MKKASRSFLSVFVGSLLLLGTRAFVPSVIPRPLVTPPPRISTASPLHMSSNAAITLYEKVRENLPSDRVVEACDGKRVIASDVATAAGVSLSQAQRDLTLLASISQGDIAVSQDGDLIYTFPKNLKGVLSAQNSRFKVEQFAKKAWPTVFWGIRVGFGVALVASLVAIYSTIFFISSSSSSDDDRRSDRRGGGGMPIGGFNYFWGPSPFDFFVYRPYGYYGYYGADVRRDPEKLGFFESVFSFVFGDGDPNQRLEEKRLKLAAQMIRENQGAVTAEQLAPFCDPDVDPDDAMKSNYVDESFVLPIVTQLNGEPTVTEDGDIVYLFPELQSTATTSSRSSRLSLPDSTSMLLKRAGLSPNAGAREIQQLLNYNGISTMGAYEKRDLLKILERSLPPMTKEEEEQLQKENDINDPSLLMEEEIPFSVATGFNKVLAGGLGVVNLGGALYLGNLLSQVTAAGYKLPGGYGTVAALYPFLLGYAILFNVIPVVRNFWVQRENGQIRKRNSMRTRWRKAVGSGFGKLKAKLAAAKKLAIKQKRLGSSTKDVIYDTSSTIEEVSTRKEQSDLSAFDQLLEKDENEPFQ